VLALPGVRSVAWASAVPTGVSELGALAFQVAGDAPVSEGQRTLAQAHVVSAAYFSTIDQPLLAGRAFTADDRADGTRVCIVDEAFVRRLGGREPIGLNVEFRSAASPNAAPTVRQIVGVARQVRRPDGTEDSVNVYLPQTQNPLDDMYLLARVEGGPADRLVSPVRGVIAQIDREQLVSIRDVATLESIAWNHGARHRFRARTMLLFAGLALLLAMIGVFGVLAYAVQQRAREFSVRIAVGATARDVLGLVISSAAVVVVTGGVIGLVLAAAFGRVMASVLFGVEPIDAVTFAAVTGLIAITAGVAAAAPAWRAAKTDPALALRVE
jgi:putative ABC transport system permease protein